ncbi:MAG: PAS domain S-box protein, partial [Nitrospiraceae bacterium]
MIEDRYYKMFRFSPVSIWEEDFSEIHLYFEKLRKKGIHDFRGFIERHPEEVLSLAGKVKIIDVNDATLNLFGARTKKELFQGLNVVFSKESYDVFREELIALFEGSTGFQSEAVNLTLTGEEKHILLRLAVTPGYEKTLSSVFVYIVDISEMKRVEEDLRESEEKYRTIFKTAYDAILIVDTDTGIILDVNQKGEDLFGMHAHEIVGLHFTQLHPKEESHIRWKQFRDHVSSGGAVSENVVICSKSGDRIPVSISSSIIQTRERKYISGLLRRMPQKAPEKRDHEALAKAPQLSSRECEIVRLIAAGLTAREIG